MDSARETEPKRVWPDHLAHPDPQRVLELLVAFWAQLDRLPDLLNRGELLLAEQNTTTLRTIVLEMMLALNGIAMLPDTRHLNGYLGESQRKVLERTLLTQGLDGESWLGKAVALTVIYRWYAPQLAEKFGLRPAIAEEEQTWAHLLAKLPSWPRTITTE